MRVKWRNLDVGGSGPGPILNVSDQLGLGFVIFSFFLQPTCRTTLFLLFSFFLLLLSSLSFFSSTFFLLFSCCCARSSPRGLCHPPRAKRSPWATIKIPIRPRLVMVAGQKTATDFRHITPWLILNNTDYTML